ncbi:MAG: sigma-70 family RNA polymerase sigma factor [Ruminococcaceae bacterium]|nr:sigma-70 family RNA polymerase sigma factor [Oscillospiraceae bacterium]
MDDKDIVSLYFAREESAITESENKYGRYLHSVAYNILYSHEDAKECVNDTYVSAWECIPPHKPTVLRTFLGKITRNIAINRYRSDHAEKRFGDTDTVIDEFFECIPSADMPIEDSLVLKDLINGFLASLDAKTRIVFMQRYWYFLSVREIAKIRGMTESNVKITLMRTREKFKQYLQKEGYTV